MTIGLQFPPVAGLDLQRPPTIGWVFYVDHINGANTNNGIDPGEAFATITFALTQCQNDRDDYIIVLEHGASGVEPAYPVVINIDRVHVIGRGREGPDRVIRIHGRHLNLDSLHQFIHTGPSLLSEYGDVIQSLVNRCTPLSLG